MKFIKEQSMGKIKLSIIIVNFNTYKFLDKCLISIFKSGLNSQDYEIVVVDNASKDDSVNLINKNFPQVILTANKKNLGFAKANNQAIRLAHGEYILFLNPDTIIPADTFSFVMNFMEINKEVGIATCRVELTDGTLDDACHRGFPTPWRALCHFIGLGNLFKGSIIFNGYHLGFCHLDKVHQIEACAGAFMMVKRQAGEEVNWLDEDYFWYGEDLDFCYRVKEKGWKIMFVPEVKILHYKGIAGGIKKHSEDISTADEETRKLATQARFEVMRIFYEKHYKNKYPGWLTNIVFAGIKLKEFLTLLRYNMKNYG